MLFSISTASWSVRKIRSDLRADYRELFALFEARQQLEVGQSSDYAKAKQEANHLWKAMALSGQSRTGQVDRLSLPVTRLRNFARRSGLIVPH